MLRSFASQVARRLGIVSIGSVLLFEARPGFSAESAPREPVKNIPAPPPAFRAGTNGEFHFDTGLLQGKWRAGGKSLGLSSVTHVPTGHVLDRSMGLFSHYRVFASGTRYGHGAWDWPGTATLRAEGAVEMRWPAAGDRPFVMSAVYRWSEAGTLDLETTVTARRALPKFEVFLASYFHERFANSLVFTLGDPAQGRSAGFVSASRSAGDWQMFPRDVAAVRLITDGRWRMEPNPVDWTIRPRLGKPLAVRRDVKSGLTAILMAPPEDCFAVATPYETEGHGSLYLSLFGRDVPAGKTVRARARLVIATNLPNERIAGLYEAYVENLGRGDRTGGEPAP